MSSSIPSWQILTAHAQPFRGARDLAFCLKVPLDSLLAWASSEGSTARMRRLAWTFAARIGDKYQIRLTRSLYYNKKNTTKLKQFKKIRTLKHPILWFQLFFLSLWDLHNIFVHNARWVKCAKYNPKLWWSCIFLWCYTKKIIMRIPIENAYCKVETKRSKNFLCFRIQRQNLNENEESCIVKNAYNEEKNILSQIWDQINSFKANVSGNHWQNCLWIYVLIRLCVRVIETCEAGTIFKYAS